MIMRLAIRFACALGLAFTVTIGFASEADAIKSITAAGGKVQQDKVNKKRVVSGVTLSGPKITDAIVKDLLEFPALSRVSLRTAPNVSMDAVMTLTKVKKLQSVELAGEIVSDDTAKALASVATITELTLEDGGLTDDGVKQLAALTKLQTLVLTRDKQVRGTTIPALVAAKNLKYLTVSECELGDLAGWSGLKSLSNLISLALPQTGVTDAGLKQLGKITQLKSVSFASCPVTDTGLAELKGLNALESLNLTETKITEQAVPILSAMKKLQFLTLNEKQIGKAGVETLKKALPNCDVNAMP
jgi:internalin A